MKKRHKQIETERQTKVKLYKSGSQWVSVMLTKLGFLNLGSMTEEGQISQLSQSDMSEIIVRSGVMKGVTNVSLALGAIIAGGGGRCTRLLRREYRIS